MVALARAGLENTARVAREEYRFGSEQSWPGDRTMIASKQMDPRAVQTFSIDWTDWPFAPGVRIASVVWTVPPALQVLDQSVSGLVTNVKLRWTSSALPATDYTVECHMVTTDPASVPFQDSRRIGIRNHQR